jgi:hypothetical protein
MFSQPNFGSLLILSTGFFLMLVAFNAAQTLSTKILQDSNFG